MNAEPNRRAESGGEILLAIPGGGDIYYRLSSNVLRAHALTHSHLLLHHSARTRRDHKVDLQVSTSMRAFALFIPACFVALPLLSSFGFWISMLGAAAIAWCIAKLLVNTKDAERPNWGWEAKEWINTESRKYVSQIETFGKAPAKNQTVKSLDAVMLLGVVNHDWESGSTNDIYLADRSPVEKITQKHHTPHILCRLHMGAHPAAEASELGRTLSEIWGIPFVNCLDDHGRAR
jgi:hypothetical protein